MSRFSDNDYLRLLRILLTGSLYPESFWQYAREPVSSEYSLFRPLRTIRALAKRMTLAVAKRSGLEVLRRERIDLVAREEGRDWPFVGLTMVGFKRLENIAECVEMIADERVPGDLVECGVWKGGAAIYMKAVADHLGLTHRNIWLADSFEGLPVPALEEDLQDPAHNLSSIEHLKVSAEQVRQNFEHLGLWDERVKILKGWFKDTLPHAPIGRIALLRLDGDLYESTRDALEELYHKVSSGGFVIIDDYNSWSSCKKAVDEFRVSHAITSAIRSIDWSAVYWQVG